MASAIITGLHGAHTEAVGRSCPKACGLSEARESSIISLAAALPIDSKPPLTRDLASYCGASDGSPSVRAGISGANDPSFLWEGLTCPRPLLPPGLAPLERKPSLAYSAASTQDRSDCSSPERSSESSDAHEAMENETVILTSFPDVHTEVVERRCLKACSPSEAPERCTVPVPPGLTMTVGLAPITTPITIPITNKPLQYACSRSPPSTYCSSDGPSPMRSGSSDANEARFEAEASMCPMSIPLPPGLSLPDTSPTCSLTSTLLRSDSASTEERSESSDAREDSEPEALSPAYQIAELVLRECAFIRTTGYRVRSEHRPDQLKNGVTECIVLCVNGLPQSKRTKWMVPLFTGIAGVLQRAGCKAKVLHGLLLVALNEEDPMVRLDMVSAF